MSFIFLVGFSVLGQTPPVPDTAQAAVAQQPTTATSAARALRDINDDVREALRRESAADGADERVVAVLNLAALYNEIIQDDRLASSPSLEMSRRRLRGRLARVKKSIERLLTQLDDGQAAGKAGPPRGGGNVDSEYAPVTAAASNEGAAAKRRGGGAWPGDQGPALVDLIERTIAPDIWDVNGGQATIVYYEPLRALVVSAPLEVHERVIGLLGDLRDARGP